MWTSVFALSYQTLSPKLKMHPALQLPVPDAGTVGLCSVSAEAGEG